MDVLKQARRAIPHSGGLIERGSDKPASPGVDGDACDHCRMHAGVDAQDGIGRGFCGEHRGCPVQTNTPDQTAQVSSLLISCPGGIVRAPCDCRYILTGAVRAVGRGGSSDRMSPSRKVAMSAQVAARGRLPPSPEQTALRQTWITLPCNAYGARRRRALSRTVGNASEYRARLAPGCRG
jgi:hypothetical protein